MRMRANDAHASSQLPELCLRRACASQDADAARTEKEPGHHVHTVSACWRVPSRRFQKQAPAEEPEDTSQSCQIAATSGSPSTPAPKAKTPKVKARETFLIFSHLLPLLAVLHKPRAS